MRLVGISEERDVGHCSPASESQFTSSAREYKDVIFSCEQGLPAAFCTPMPIVYICSRGSNADYEDSQRYDRGGTSERSEDMLFIVDYLLLLLPQATSVPLTKVYSLIRLFRSQ